MFVMKCFRNTVPKLDLREMIEKEKKKQKSSFVKDDFRPLNGEEKKNSTFSEIDIIHDFEKPKKKSIFLGTDLKYLNELQIDASENPRLLELFSFQSDAEVNFQDSKLETTSDFSEQKSLVPGTADLRQLINGLKQKPSKDPKLDHSLKSDSEFEICSENREIKPKHEIFRAEFVSKSFNRFDEEIAKIYIYKNMSKEELLYSLKDVLSDDFDETQVNSKEIRIESKDVKMEWPGTELDKLSKHGEIENNRIEFEVKITSKNSTVPIHKKLKKVKSSPLRYFLDRDRKEQEIAAKNAEFEKKIQKLTSENGKFHGHKSKSKPSPLRYFLERDKKEKEVAAKNAEFERCHTNIKSEEKTRTKIRFNIDKAEEVSSIDEEKIISGYDLQNTGKRMQFLSKLKRKKENELLGTNINGFQPKITPA